jgi:hypothetical protein
VGELRVCTLAVVDGSWLERGHLVLSDDERVAAHPEPFEPWAPPEVEPGLAACPESFVGGERMVMRGELLLTKDSAVKHYPGFITEWSAPPVRLANGEIWSEPPRRPLLRWLTKGS